MIWDPAHTQDLGPVMQAIEDIQREENGKPHAPFNLTLKTPDGSALHFDGPCVAFTLAKISRLLAAGVQARAVLVLVEPSARRAGEEHMVAEVDGNLNGQAVELILDQRVSTVVYKTDLTRIGYTWAPAAPEPDRRLP